MSPAQVEPIAIVGDWLGQADPEVVKEHKGARHVIRREKFEEAGDTTVKDAIRKLPGVQVPENNGTGSGDFALNIGMRGLGSRLTSRATVLLDGVPMSNAPYGQPQLSLAPVSLGNLEAIDVVKGGSAVRYGPQNVGGVINFVTKPIPKGLQSSITVRGDIYGADADGTGKGNVDASVGATGDNGFGLGVFYSGNHGQGFRDNHDQDIDDAMVKYAFETSENGRLEGKLHHYRATADLPGPINSAQFRDDPFQSTHSYEEFEGDRTELTGKYIHDFDNDLQLEVGAFATDSFREYTLANGDDANLTRLDRLPREYRVMGVEPRISGLAFTGDVAHEWSVGYRYVREDMNEKRYRRTVAAGGDPYSVAATKNRDSDADVNAHALYIDNRMDWQQWTVTPGVRFEKVSIERTNKLTDFQDSEDYTEVLPSMNIGYHLNEETLLYANYNESFAAVGHMALGTSADTDLDPERATTYEVGVRYDDGALQSDATLFWIDFDNQIEYDASVGMNVNKGKTRHRGLELATSYDMAGLSQSLQGLSVFGSYAYTKAESNSGEFKGNDLKLYSRHTGTVGTRYAMDDWVFNLNGYAQSDQYADDENTDAQSADGTNGIIPGFAIWDTKVTKDLSDRNGGLEVGFGVKNILDRRHYTRASIENNGGIYVGAPRTFFAEVKATF